MITAAARAGVARHHILPVVKRPFPGNTRGCHRFYRSGPWVHSAVCPSALAPHSWGKAGFTTAVIEPAESISVEDETLNYMRGLVEGQTPGRALRPLQPESEQSFAASPSLDLRSLPTPFIGAIIAMRRKDTRLFLIYLRNISRLPSSDLREAIKSLPRSTFTEFISCLDPLYVSRDADPTHELFISTSMYEALDASELLNEYGVRKIYIRIVDRLKVILQAFRESGQELQMTEYHCLLRCAGAASDINFAKYLWRLMDQDGVQAQRTTETYTEYIGARFLTEPLYGGFDKTVAISTPRTVSGRKALHPNILQSVDMLNMQYRSRKGRYGLNRERPDESLGRELDESRPIERMARYLANKKGIGHTDELLHRLIIAYGRCGRLRSMSKILEDYFGITMTRLTYNKKTSGTWYREMQYQQYGRYYKMDNVMKWRPALFKPSPRLMEVLAEGYGCMGEVDFGLNVVEYISQTYKIPIPLSVWSCFLEWTYLHSVSPYRDLWRLAHLKMKKVPGLLSVQILWEKMVSAPHNIQPEFPQYRILIRKLVAQCKLSDALPFMREAHRLYKDQCLAFENALFEYRLSLSDNVFGVMGRYHEYERARVLRAAMWYEMRSWVRTYLNAIQVTGVHDTRVTQQVPDLIDEFGEFVDKTWRYRIATGLVVLKDPSKHRHASSYPDPKKKYRDYYDPGARVIPHRQRLVKTGQWVTRLMGEPRRATRVWRSRYSLRGHKTTASVLQIILGRNSSMRKSGRLRSVKARAMRRMGVRMMSPM